jgi:hypothetical protein
MPIIIDHTPVDGNLISSLASGYASQVLRRQREQDQLGDQVNLDSARTDNNIRQQRALGDYALGQLPARLGIENTAAVDQARMMLPVHQQGYQQQLDAQAAAHEAATATLRARRAQEWGPIEQQLSASPPDHVQPWMVALAKNDYLADGRIDHGTYDLLRPRTAGEQLAEKEQAGKLKLFQQSVEAPDRAAEAYRALRMAGSAADGPPDPRGPQIDPKDEYVAQGLASGHFKLSDPFVRERLGMLSPGEIAAQERAKIEGSGENILRLRIENDPEYYTAKATFQAAEHYLAAKQKGEGDAGFADDDKIAEAEDRLQKARVDLKKVHDRIKARLTGQPEPQPDPAAPKAPMPPATQMQRDALGVVATYNPHRR